MNDNTQPQTQNDLLDFFKALAHSERLKIAGALAQGPANALQLSEQLNIPPLDVLHHMDSLEQIGLVWAEAGERIATPDGLCGPMGGRETPPIYHFDKDALHKLSKRVLAGSRPQPRMEDFDGDAFDRKVLKDFMNVDGTIKSLPSQEKKLLAILRHVAQAFQADERLPEKQVNERLKRFYADTATLRRCLVDHNLMARADGLYWKV